MEKPVLQLSVRALAEYCLASGNLVGDQQASAERALEGARAHRLLQKRALEADADFRKEVSFSIELDREFYTLRVSGRADGVFTSAAGICIQEIKTTYLPLEELTEAHYPAYHAQLDTYGYLCALENGLKQITLRLTYYQLQQKKERSFERIETFETLKRRFDALTEDYFRISDNAVRHRLARNRALQSFSFPFASYRPSQHEFAAQVYTCVKQRNTLFAQAPTGTGKTIGTLFPALKALGAGLCDKIFYLTAKNQTGVVAQDTLEYIKQKSLPLKTITITAKDRACLLHKRSCTPEDCPYCRDYYQKQHAALPEILTLNSFTPETLQELALRFELCPYELSLSVSEYCDCIICDYNYIFHPIVRFQRYFSQHKGKYVFLIDEAHNLPERVRDIFSAELSVSQIRAARSACRELTPLYRALGKLASAIEAQAKAHEEETAFLLPSPPKEVYAAAVNTVDAAALCLESGHAALPNAFSALYQALLDFIMVYERYNEDLYKTYMQQQSGGVSLRVLCLQSAPFVREGLNLARASVLFSATLEPHSYYMTLMGADELSYYYAIPSPFDPDNLLVVTDDTIATTYNARTETYPAVAQRIYETVTAKPGNYLVYFPSYAYLNAVLEIFRTLDAKTETVVHLPGMKKGDKDAFLNAFLQNRPTVGFSVLGGHFGEGIDLPGELLLGAIIVGVGLPQLSCDRNLIKAYFDEQYFDGYAYSYIYPGMNRVLQAAGRVIRTAEDRGVILLIDTRFARPPYDELFPDHWRVRFLSQEDVSYSELLEDFWQNHSD